MLSYYRLSVFPIVLPALRERPEDIPLLATYFGEKFSRRLSRPFRGLREGCLAQLLAYPWPGNVRELENVIEHAVIISNGQPLDCQRLALTFPAAGAEPPARCEAPNLSEMRVEHDQQERARIEAVLLQTHWRICGAGGAAAILRMKPTTLEARMRRLGVQK